MRPTNDSSSLNQLIVEFLQAELAGRKMDREELLARRPELAESLHSFFANHDRMQGLAKGSTSESPTRPPSPVERDAPTVAPARSGTVQDTPTLPPDAAVESSRHTPCAVTGDGTRSVPATFVRYFGDYELLEEIARGGMGVVYKARQVNLNRIVALKMILAGQLASKDDVQRFYTEAEAAASLDHPGIVPIYEVGQHEGQHYFSMGFVEGQSLAAKVAAGPLPPREAADLTRTIAEAIAYAHSKGVIHRDLKPANILLQNKDEGGRQTKDEGGRMKEEKEKTPASGSSFIPHPSSFPRVTDFGLAKKIETESGLTHTGAILGTPSYMPPEQAAGKVVGPLADVYSLGAILYCLLTGRPPFQAASPLDTLLQVLGEEPISPRQLNPKLPRDLETIALKCLEKDPARRYADAAGLAADLARYLNHEPILARPSTAWERSYKWIRRRPTVSALAAAVLITLVGGAAVSNYFAFQARAQAHFARGHLYVAHMNLTQRAWEDSQFEKVLDLLERQRPAPGEEDLRGFEWHYWNRLAHSYQLNLDADTGPVYSVAFSVDGKWLASGNMDQTVKVWDATSGEALLTLPGHTDQVKCVAFSRDGKRLASASFDRTVKVWDTTSGQPVLTLKGHGGQVMGVAFSADGKWLASASVDQTVKVWDAASGLEVLTLQGHTGAVLSVAFSPDGKRLASASGDLTLKVWDVEGRFEVLTTRERIKQLLARHKVAASVQETLTLKGHDREVTSVAFSPDGKRLASASWDQTVKVWDSTSGESLLTIKAHMGAVSSVAFSSDGKRLASGGADKMAKLWDAASGRELFAWKGHTGQVTGVAFSEDGKRLASASADQTVKVWDATRGQESLTMPGHTGQVMSVAFSADGKQLASASGDNTVKVWDAASGRETITLSGHTGRVSSVVFSPDGKRLASASWDHTVKVWDATSGKVLLTLKGHTGPVSSVAFSANGKWLASAGGFGDHTVRVWDATNGEETRALNGHTGQVTSVAFGPNGKRLASAGDDWTVKLWDAATGQERLTLKGHTSSVMCVAFSADGKRLASAGGVGDHTVKVWDATNGQEIQTLKGHTSQVLSVAFSADGKRLASASGDKTLKVWDVATGQEALTLSGPGAWHCVAFQPGRAATCRGGECDNGLAVGRNAID